MKKATLFYEWTSLPKDDFRILVMLADNGPFTGTLSDICRYFFLNPQNKTRASIRTSIEALTNQQYITGQLQGYTYRLWAIPQEQKIDMPCDWLRRLRSHEYSSEAVSWENVLKVFLWIAHHNSNEIVTNKDIAADLHISSSTIVSAKNVLLHEFEAISKEYITTKIGTNFYQRLGQHLTASAWWKE